MGSMRGAVVIDTERCKGCSLCVGACPLSLLSLVERRVNRKGYPYVEQSSDGCTGCSSCGIVCPDGCITVYRVKVAATQAQSSKHLVAAV